MERLPYWLVEGTEECEICHHVHVLQMEIRCTGCDRGICEQCVVRVWGADALLCHECHQEEEEE